jgi:hypothetical protein
MSFSDVVSDLYHGPDYTGQFQAHLDEWDGRGDFGGDTLRYAIFSTLNNGPSTPGYRQDVEYAKRVYGLTGFGREPVWRPVSSRTILAEYTSDVVQPTVGTWLSITQWLFWFKVGFLGS